MARQNVNYEVEMVANSDTQDSNTFEEENCFLITIPSEGALITEGELSVVIEDDNASDEGCNTEKEKQACPFCDKVLTRVSEHIRLLHRTKAFDCPKEGCGKVFKTLKNLRSHQLTCFNMKKEFKCEFCDKEFHRKSNWIAHEKRHKVNQLQCALCDKTFVDTTGLRRHFMRQHHDRPEVFVSECCGKIFKSLLGKRKHESKGCKFVAFLGEANSIPDVNDTL